MKDFPENKQKRLMSLNQDVLAVSPQKSSRAEPVRKPQPKRPGLKRPEVAASVAQAPQQPASSMAFIGLSLLACAALLVAVVSLIFAFDSKEQIQQLSAQLNKPDPGFASLEVRISALEGRLDAAGQETNTMDEQSQASLLQINSRVRKVAMDASRLGAELEQLKRQQSASRANNDTESKIAQQASRISTLESKIASLAGRPVPQPAGSSVSAERLEQQLLRLNTRIEKQASEIKTIYRMLEAQ